MPKGKTGFEKAIDQLQAVYGRPKRPKVTDPLGLILLENVAYLLSDERRETAFKALQKRIGLEPDRILSAPTGRLLEIARMGGMLPEGRAVKLRQIAQIVLRDFQGDLKQVLNWPLPQARKAFKKFPGIGDPGAEKIFLFTRTHPILALESNGLRVLIRLGFGEKQENYLATYRSVQEALKGQLPPDCSSLVRAHQLLRQHGQEICRRSDPGCLSCPLSSRCHFYQAGISRTIV